MIIRFFLVCLVIAVVSLRGLAEETPLRFSRLDSGDGLSADWIRCFFQDERGMMWIGTSFGLDRYDGTGVKTFRMKGESGFEFNMPVNAILSEEADTFLVGTDSGLFRFLVKEERFQGMVAVTNRPVLDMLRDAKGHVWLCTDRVVVRFGGGEERRLYLANGDSPMASYANAVFEDSRGRIWVGTKNGLSRYDEASDRFVAQRSGGGMARIERLDILDIEEDAAGRIWLAGAANGLFWFDGEDRGDVAWNRIRTGKAIRLKVDGEGALWVAQGGVHGLMRADLETFSGTGQLESETFRNDPLSLTSLSGDSVFSLFEDREGGIWVGTLGKGLNYVSRYAKPFRGLKKGPDPDRSLQEEMVNCLFEEEDYLWIGTNGGLERMDKRDGSFRRYRNEVGNESSLGSDAIFSVFKDSRGNLWVGGWTSGLNRFDYETETFERYVPGDEAGAISSSIVFDIMEDSLGNLWIGTLGGGLNRYDYETGQFVVYRYFPDDGVSFGMDDVNRVIESEDGYLYLAASRSFGRFDRSTGTFVRYDHSETATNGSSGGYVVDAMEDSEGRIWLATRAGLELFDRATGRFRVFGEADGLPSAIVSGFLEDERGNLWVSTANGLSIFEGAIQNPDTGRFRNVSRYDGLASGQFNARAQFKGEDGTFYFGSSGGVSYIQPESIVFNESPPSMALTDFLLLERDDSSVLSYRSLGRSVDHMDRVELSYDEASFMIRYAALNYLNPDQNRYRYALVGHGRDWVDAGISTSVAYSQLPPGSYVFQVMGSNNDGVWSKSAKEIAIVVTPPWWQTVWFRAFGVLVVGVILVSVYRIRFAVMRKNQLALERKVAERTATLRELNGLLEERQIEIEEQNNELLRHRERLEEIVDERTRKLLEEKLKAEEADRLKSSFLMNMSHEIRTPMNAVIGFSSLLHAEDLSEAERGHFVEAIKKNGSDLLVLIDEILDISLIETNQLKLYPEIFDVDETLKETFEGQRLNREKPIEYRLIRDGGDSDVRINADPVRFRELVNNFLSNAYKFTESGTIELRYGVSNGVLRVEVNDSGIGIDESDHDKVFDHFYKVERDKSRLYRGTGIGLSICSKIVSKMGGRIGLESELGKGALFWFELPQGELVTDETHKVRSEAQAVDLSGLTVLVAEDDDTNAEVVWYALERSGADLHRVKNGREALAFVEAREKDLDTLVVLMDIKMPEMDGEEACRELRGRYSEGLTLIALTAHAQRAERERFEALGFDRVVTKPIATEGLAREVWETHTNR